MTDFLQNILLFPTLFYTGLLALTLLYWLVATMGLADFDFDFGEIDVDAGEALEASGLLSKFKLDGIPITISISFIIFLSWVLCFLFVHFYLSDLTTNVDTDKKTEVNFFLGIWVIFIAPVIAASITGILLSPLKPLFEKLKEEAEGQKADSLVGNIAIIRTNKVTMNFGDADIDSGGASLILKVRAEEPNTLKRGDRVLITHYLPEENTYKIKPAP